LRKGRTVGVCASKKKKKLRAIIGLGMARVSLMDMVQIGSISCPAHYRIMGLMDLDDRDKQMKKTEII
jgi:hypothetical protein